MKIFADTANFVDIIKAASIPQVMGVTTNPTLMRQAGVKDYTAFAQRVINYLKRDRSDTCLSLEVFADTYPEMMKQARIISDWGITTSANGDYPVYVKIPITNTKGISNVELIGDLIDEGIRVNVTAVFTKTQVMEVLDAIDRTKPSIISVFAGRIADAGVDPEDVIDSMTEYWADTMAPPEGKKDLVEFLWASCREPFSWVAASRCGCDIITMNLPQIQKMLQYQNKDLTEFSLDTVKQFYNDAVLSGYTI